MKQLNVSGACSPKRLRTNLLPLGIERPLLECLKGHEVDDIPSTRDASDALSILSRGEDGARCATK